MCLFIFESISYSPCWPPSHHIAKDGLEPVIFPFPFFKYWDCNYTPPLFSAGDQTRANNRDTSLPSFVLLVGVLLCASVQAGLKPEVFLSQAPFDLCSDFNVAISRWSSEISSTLWWLSFPIHEPMGVFLVCQPQWETVPQPETHCWVWAVQGQEKKGWWGPFSPEAAGCWKPPFPSI